MINDDFLEDVLQPPIREAPAAVRGALRDRTAGVVRWRRYRRLALKLVVAAAAQGATLAAIMAWLLASGTFVWQKRPAAQSEAPAAQNRDAPLELPSPVTDDTPLSAAVALEWKAFDAAPEERAKLYFQAAQRYFDDHQDFSSALRRYRQAFDAGPKDLLTVSPSDNWLVMAIKIDCRKEN